MQQENYHSGAAITVWAVSEATAGIRTQCLGIGHYLDPVPLVKTVADVPTWKRLFQPPSFTVKEARPDIIVSCGVRSETTALKMRRAFNGHPLAVHLQHPRIEGYDLVFVSRHDWKKEFAGRPHYHSVVGVPHRISAERISPLRKAARSRFAPNGEPIAAVFIGGPNGAYAYDEKCRIRIRQTIQTLAEQGWRVLVSVSRRSDLLTLNALRTLQSESIEVWDRTGDNPFIDYIAAADAFLIAKDSITMPCEALAMGKPVYTMELTHIPGGRLAKFERFHHDLQDTLKLTRPFGGDIRPYDYEPLNETARIAGIVEATWAGRP